MASKSGMDKRKALSPTPRCAEGAHSNLRWSHYFSESPPSVAVA